MKKTVKILSLLILTILLISNSTYIYASEPNPDLVGTAKNWINLGKDEADKTGNGSTKKWSKFNDLAGMLWGVGIFVILICGVIMGIKYMFASLEEKASIKESLKPYIIGSVIIIGALGIWQLLVELLNKI